MLYKLSRKLCAIGFNCIIEHENLKARGYNCFKLQNRSAGNEKIAYGYVYEPLLWQQSRFNMAANYQLIAFIAQTTPMTPILFSSNLLQ